MPHRLRRDRSVPKIEADSGPARMGSQIWMQDENGLAENTDSASIGIEKVVERASRTEYTHDMHVFPDPVECHAHDARTAARTACLTLHEHMHGPLHRLL